MRTMKVFSVTLGLALYRSSRKGSTWPFGGEGKAEVKGLKLSFVPLTSPMTVIGRG